jgi:DNA polymerase-3 subunit gamma/tau
MDSSSSSYVVIARRYRPQRFDQVLGQDAVVATLKNAILQGRVAQAYLFCGTRGTGKTTLARLLAKALNCPNRGNHADPCGACTTCREIAAGISLDVLEIDGASNRGIDDIRTLTESAPYAAAGGGFKVTIIDEVHMLTKEAFNALLKTLEEPPPNLKFIFATTEPHKVPATILSRCQRFDLARIPTDVLIKKLRLIAAEMGREIREEALYLIASQAEGSFRDSESLLDQVLAYQAQGAVEAPTAAVALGLAPRALWFHLDQAVQSQSLEQALEIAQMIIQSGIDVTQALEQLLEHLRCHLLHQLGRLPLAMPAEWVAQYQASASAYQRDQLLHLLDELSVMWQQARQQTPSIWTLEHALLVVVRSAGRLSLESVVRRLIDLESRLSHGSSVPPSVPEARVAKSAPTPAAAPSPTPAAGPVSGAGQAASVAARAAPSDQAVRATPQPLFAAAAPVAAKAPIGTKASAGVGAAKASSKAPAPRPAATEATKAPPSQASAAAPQAVAAANQIEQEPGEPPLPPGRLDTLMRFAAVELEGILQPPPKR